MTAGVPMHLLRCPTCFGIMGAEVRWSEPDEAWQIMEHPGVREVIVSHNKPYLTCQHGHRWTIKVVTRTTNKPDEILLGEYLGEL